MKDKKKFRITIRLRTKEDDTIKDFEIHQTYEGDPAKLDVSVMIDAWFIETNVDKSCLHSMTVYVDNESDDYMIPCCY